MPCAVLGWHHTCWDQSSTATALLSGLFNSNQAVTLLYEHLELYKLAPGVLKYLDKIISRYAWAAPLDWLLASNCLPTKRCSPRAACHAA